mmetsp:Transcript_89209/g.160941  ORF Transcript_89209/g.160941 Transcript_89209/m.160941 type:complete len:206 (-) Transcript_89209:73-690(-)
MAPASTGYITAYGALSVPTTASASTEVSRVTMASVPAVSVPTTTSASTEGIRIARLLVGSSWKASCCCCCCCCCWCCCPPLRKTCRGLLAQLLLAELRGGRLSQLWAFQNSSRCFQLVECCSRRFQQQGHHLQLARLLQLPMAVQELRLLHHLPSWGNGLLLTKPMRLKETQSLADHPSLSLKDSIWGIAQSMPSETPWRSPQIA